MTAVRSPVQITRIPIRWGDMDAQGHVNNAVYFRYMEQARIEWLDRARAYAGPLPGIGQVIATATCNFILPLAYPGTVEVRMFFGQPGRSSVESLYELLSDGRKYADGSARIVWIDSTTLKSTQIPDALRAFCGMTYGVPSSANT
jgi:acyl-CoA thioester hydrolase